MLGGDDGGGGGEAFAEIFGEADALGGRDGGEDGDAFEFEGVAGEFGHDGALEVVDEADAEDVVSLGGDVGVGGAGGDEGDFGGLGDGGGFEGAAGGDLAEDDGDLVAGDEFLDDGGGLAGLGLVVLSDQLEFAAEEAAGGVGLFDGEERALVGVLAEDGFLAGHRGEFAELDGVLGEGGGRDEGAGEKGEERPEGERHRRVAGGWARSQGEAQQVFNQSVGGMRSRAVGVISERGRGGLPQRWKIAAPLREFAVVVPRGGVFCEMGFP